MIGKVTIRFWYKSQFQILLQFHWTAEKLIKIRLVIVMAKSFDIYTTIFSIFTILVTILFSDD